MIGRNISITVTITALLFSQACAMTNRKVLQQPYQQMGYQQPGMGYQQPGMMQGGMDPNMGMQQGYDPNMGMQQGMGMDPNMGMQQGMDPSMGMQQGMDPMMGGTPLMDVGSRGFEPGSDEDTAGANALLIAGFFLFFLFIGFVVANCFMKGPSAMSNVVEQAVSKHPKGQSVAEKTAAMREKLKKLRNKVESATAAEASG